jgi:hypothetical protein
MKRLIQSFLAALFVCLLSAGIYPVHAGDLGNQDISFSSWLADNPNGNSIEPLIIRNRLDSGWPWNASADALIMTRSGGKTSSLLLNAGTGGELFNAKDFIFPWSVGPRVSVVAEDILCGCDVEASYFGMDGWSAEKSVIAPAAGAQFMVFGQSAATIPAGSSINYYYVSRLHNAEINVRHQIWECLDFLMGFRYVELHEVLASTVNTTDYLNDNVDNHLYGGQIGMNAQFVCTDRISIEGVLKAGVFGENSDITMQVLNRSLLSGQVDHTAALGEVGLIGIFQITDRLSARLGYQAMWLDGIAIAGDQVENLNPSNPKPYMGGTLFYHGAMAGFEFVF